MQTKEKTNMRTGEWKFFDIATESGEVIGQVYTNSAPAAAFKWIQEKHGRVHKLILGDGDMWVGETVSGRPVPRFKVLTS